MKRHTMKRILLATAILLSIHSFAQNQGTVTGYVLTEYGDTLSGAQIFLDSRGVAQSQPDGSYSLTSASGEHQVGALYTGFKQSTVTVNVIAGKTIRQDFTLQSKNPPVIDSITVEEVEKEKVLFSLQEESMVLTDAAAAKRFYPNGNINANVQHNTESYSEIKENRFLSVKSEPLSTFSIDVDNASYSNMRRFINRGEKPPKDALRVEELINYFDYAYTSPGDNDETPFSVHTEYSDCPWNEDHKIIHIGIQGKTVEMKDVPPSNLVFLIDVSGSMSAENKLPLLKKSLKLLVDQLRPDDRIAIVVYASASGLSLESTPVSEADKIKSQIDGLNAGGSTAGGEGIQLAYKVAQENFIENGNNRIILCTDGDFNVGVSDNGSLVDMIEEKRENGVFLSILGYGMGNYKDDKMEAISNAGNGNYAYIDNFNEARKMLVNQMTGTLLTIAKDVKIQVEFNPKYVKEYKLIGYENRMLENEDFNDDKKDAGELGAGHTVTAIYEIVPAGSDENLTDVDDLRYQTSTETNDPEAGKELLTVKLRYKAPDRNKSKLIEKHVSSNPVHPNNTSQAFRFSSAVATFGLAARESEHRGNATVDLAIEIAQGSKGEDPNGYRSEFIELMKSYKLLD